MQTAIVIVLIAGALVYLGNKGYRSLLGKKKPGCDKCDKP